MWCYEVWNEIFDRQFAHGCHVIPAGCHDDNDMKLGKMYEIMLIKLGPHWDC